MFLRAAALVVALAVTSSVAPRAETAANATVSPGQADDPCIVITRDARDGRTLVAAIWDDGAVLCPASPWDKMSPLLVVQADATDIAKVVGEVRRNMPCPGGIPLMIDSAHTTIKLRGENGAPRTAMRWSENLKVLRGDPPKDSVVSAVQCWMRIRGLISSIPLKSAKLVDECFDARGKFRGFDPDKPSETDWWQ